MSNMSIAMVELRRACKIDDVVACFGEDFCVENQIEFIKLIENDLVFKGPLPQNYLRRVLVAILDRCQDISDELGEALAATFQGVEEEEISYLSYRIMNHNIILRCYNRQNELGLRLWPAAEMVAAYVATENEKFENVNIIELGAGLGLIGIVAANVAKPKSVILTDCDETVLRNLRFVIEDCNVSQQNNTHEQTMCHVEFLDWTSFDNHSNAPFTNAAIQHADAPLLVIAADCVYDPLAAHALAHVLAQIARKRASSNAATTFWLANEVRNAQNWDNFIQFTLLHHGLHVIDDFSSCAVQAIDSTPSDRRLLAPSIWRRLRASALDSRLRLLRLAPL